MATTCPSCQTAVDTQGQFCPHCGAPLAGAPRPLRRSNRDARIAGVCGGIAEYFGLDATLVRAGYVAVTVLSGVVPGLILYVLLIAVIPRRSFPA